jgi:hypothetical protein
MAGMLYVQDDDAKALNSEEILKKNNIKTLSKMPKKRLLFYITF